MARPDVLVGPVAIYKGVAGAKGNVLMALTQGDTSFEQTKENKEIECNESLRPIKTFTTSVKEVIKFSILESTLANLGMVLETSSVNGNTLTLTSNATDEEISLMLLGKGPNNVNRVWDSPYVKNTGNVTYKFSKKDESIIEVEVTILEQPGVAPLTITDGVDLAKTLSSGTFAATSLIAFIKSESGVTDDLTSITGLNDGDIIIVQPYAGHTITAKQATDTLELYGSIDFVMTPKDSLTLKYVAAGTKLVEIARVDA